MARPTRLQQKAASRTRILAVAAQMFETDGFRATTIRDIATAAGMSTGAIFSQWPDKEALFAACFPDDHRLNRVAEGICEGVGLDWARTDLDRRSQFICAAYLALAALPPDGVVGSAATPSTNQRQTENA